MAWEVGKPLIIETIDVQPPKAREVRVKVSLYKTVARAIREGVEFTDLSLTQDKTMGGRSVCHSLLYTV